MNDFIKRWQFVRSETLEILKSLNDQQLTFKPEGEEWQTIYHQFGCIGRAQLIYAKAAETGIMDFSLFVSDAMPNKDTYKTVDSILKFLEEANDTWLTALSSNKGGVVWPDESKPLKIHIMSLAEHERLHHGQLIAYFTLAGFRLPVGFKQNWAL